MGVRQTDQVLISVKIEKKGRVRTKGWGPWDDLEEVCQHQGVLSVEVTQRNEVRDKVLEREHASKTRGSWERVRVLLSLMFRCGARGHEAWLWPTSLPASLLWRRPLKYSGGTSFNCRVEVLFSETLKHLENNLNFSCQSCTVKLDFLTGFINEESAFELVGDQLVLDSVALVSGCNWKSLILDGKLFSSAELPGWWDWEDEEDAGGVAPAWFFNVWSYSQVYLGKKGC